MKNKIKVIFLDIDGVLNGPSRIDMFIFAYIGSKIEFDPKGVVRLFVKENFSRILNTKV